MRYLVPSITIMLSIILIIGILIGLQHIISDQAQIAFDEYQAIHSTIQKLNLDTLVKTSSETSP